jgi:hypothetical protein
MPHEINNAREDFESSLRNPISVSGLPVCDDCKKKLEEEKEE